MSSTTIGARLRGHLGKIDGGLANLVAEIKATALDRLEKAVDEGNFRLPSGYGPINLRPYFRRHGISWLPESGWPIDFKLLGLGEGVYDLVAVAPEFLDLDLFCEEHGLGFYLRYDKESKKYMWYDKLEAGYIIHVYTLKGRAAPGTEGRRLYELMRDKQNEKLASRFDSLLDSGEMFNALQRAVAGDNDKLRSYAVFSLPSVADHENSCGVCRETESLDAFLAFRRQLRLEHDLFCWVVKRINKFNDYETLLVVSVDRECPQLEILKSN